MGRDDKKPIPCLWCSGTKYTPAGILCGVCGGTGDAGNQIELNRIKSEELLEKIQKPT